MMNRSFRAQESLIPTSSRTRVPHVKSVKGSSIAALKDREDDLALFMEMRKREKERSDLLCQSTEELVESFALQPGSSPLFNITSSMPVQNGAPDYFLNSDNDKNDYDWLLTPPGTPLFPSLEMESRKAYACEPEAPKVRSTVLKSRLASPQSETVARGSSSVSRQRYSSPGLSTSGAGIRRSSSAGGPGSRPGTPTGRPALTGPSKPARASTPTTRPTVPSTKPSFQTPSTRTTPVNSTRSSAFVPSTKPSVSSRSSTPLRSTPRSSTPTARPTIPAVGSTPRASTPTRRPSTPSSAPTATTATITRPSSTVHKSGSTPSKNPVPPRSSSPTVRPRPVKPSEVPGFSRDAPPNLRTSVPERPLSATRGRPSAPAARSSSVEHAVNPRQRRQSCSPSRGRAPNGSIHTSGSSVPAINRARNRVSDDVSPVVVGTKMVERVVNMRKLGPPRQDANLSPGLSGKSASSPDSLGFGRTLSKKSLDMAIRHMDIRRSMPGNLRPLLTNIPASSLYSVRSGPTGSRTISVSDSPLATSSNASSELSVTNNTVGTEGKEVGDQPLP